MHAVVLAEEYSPEYRLSEVLAGLRKHNLGSKLLPVDSESNSKKIILCHVRKGESECKAAKMLRSSEKLDLDDEVSENAELIGMKRLRSRKVKDPSNKEDFKLDYSEFSSKKEKLKRRARKSKKQVSVSPSESSFVNEEDF